MVIAPGRARRPGADAPPLDPPGPEELDACPFCEGREDRTPPETLALGRDADAPNTPGWLARVVPNLYPAFERQEVVIHTPRHARSVAELTEDEVALVARAWQARRAAEPAGYLHASVNEGRAAGASLPHSHSQLVWLERTPPLVAEERTGVLPELLELPVAERDGVVAAAHPAGGVPYELLIAPRSPEPEAFTSPRLNAAIALLREAIRRLRELEGPVPFNAWLHDAAHWHLHVVPRLSTPAGIELGAGIYVNTLAPEAAAERLRGAG